MDHEKKSAIATARSISTEEHSSSYQSKEHSSNDQPSLRASLLQVAPLSGLVALLVAACCVLASLGILLGSDGQSIASWPIQPAVYLAIIAAVTNSALQVARTQALPIDWWYTASRGTTVKELERRWEAGTGVASAVLLGTRYVGKVSIVSLAMALFIIDGPLLQRASTVGPGTRSSNVTLELMLSPEVPTGFSGFEWERGQMPSNIAGTVTQDWLHKRPMVVNVTGCKGSCSGIARGPGVVKTDCSSYTWPVNKEILHSANATWGTWKVIDLLNPGSVFMKLPWFEVTMVPLHAASPREGAFLRIGRMHFVNLVGGYTEQVCHLVPVTMNYNITINDGKITSIAKASPGNMTDLVNNTRPFTWFNEGVKKQPITLDTLTWYLAETVMSNVTAVMEVPSLPGEIWQYTAWSMNAQALKYMAFKGGYYSTNFYDPMPDIVKDYNELLFRAGLASAHWSNLTDLIDPGLSARQAIRAQQHEYLDVFHSDLRWWVGAAVIDLLTIFIILPLFNRWWNFERSRTLSPFELALAFDSPLVKNVPSTAGAEGVIRRLGNVRVQFKAAGYGYNRASQHEGETVDETVYTGPQPAESNRRYSISVIDDVT